MKVSYCVCSTNEQETTILILLASNSKFWKDNEVDLKFSKGESETSVEQFMEIIGEYNNVKHIAEDLFGETDFDKYMKKL